MGDRRQPSRRQRLRSRARRGCATARVPAVRDRTARGGRSHRRRAPAARQRALGPVRRGRGRQSERVVAAGVLARGDPHRLPRQPHGVLPVPEAHVRQHRRRPGRGECCCARTKPRAPPASPTTAWCSCTRRPRRTTTTSSASGGRSASRRASPPRSATRSAPRASALDDVARFDLYSCFPSAVQVAMRALGIADDDARPLTVTGGLGFAGGPVNNYPTHAIARMVEVLRGDPGELRLHHRARLVHLEARGRRVVGNAARARLPARRSRNEPGQGRRAAAPRGRGPRRRHGHDRGDVGCRRTRRHADPRDPRPRSTGDGRRAHGQRPRPRHARRSDDRGARRPDRPPHATTAPRTRPFSTEAYA